MGIKEKKWPGMMKKTSVPGQATNKQMSQKKKNREKGLKSFKASVMNQVNSLISVYLDIGVALEKWHINLLHFICCLIHA